MAKTKAITEPVIEHDWQHDGEGNMLCAHCGEAQDEGTEICPRRGM